MDQCKHCTARGDIKACEAETLCSHHLNWYATTLTAERDELRRKLEELREAVEKYLSITDAADMAVIDNTLTTDVLTGILHARSEVDRLIAQGG